MSNPSPPSAEPVLSELLRYEYLAASEEMLVTMRRATRSVLAREGADYGAAILDVHGRIVAQVVPYGFMYFHTAVPRILAKFCSGGLSDGDVVVTNDPYGGGSHLPDLIVLRPIYGERQLLGYTAVAQHHTDIGGRFPGGNGSASQSLFEEGLRLPGVKLVERGIASESVHQIIAANVREPEDVLGDLAAAVASCERGAQAVARLAGKYGADRLSIFCESLLATSEAHMRKVIARLQPGTYTAVAPFSDDEVSVDIHVELTVGDRELGFDFSRTSPQVDRALNVPFGMTAAVPIHAMLGLLGGLDGASLNSGLLGPIQVEAREGTAVNPRFPAPVGSRAQLYNRLVQACREALAQAAPTLFPAPGEGCNGAIYVSPASTAESRFRMLTEFYASGWGARASADGVDGVMGMMLSGFRSASAEVTEAELPVAIEGFGFVPDSGGPGRHRGSLAVYRRWRFLDDARVLVRDTLPGATHPGREGGLASSSSSLQIIKGGRAISVEPRALHDLTLERGDVLEYALPSGAGYGDPLTRNPLAVREDVCDEKVSRQQAEAIYGVVLDDVTGELDVEATSQRRSSRKGEL